MITVVMPYYENPTMFQIQQDVWAQYPLHEAEFIVVDDGSPNYPAVDYVQRQLPLKIYRIKRDIPWGQHAARNLGMAKCSTDWAFLTDIDHVLPKDHFENLLYFNKRNKDYYTVSRRNTDGSEYEYHPNTFLLRYKQFWKVNSYDERFVGSYGGDGQYRKALDE